MANSNQFTITNSLNKPLEVYTTFTNVHADSPSTNPEDYIPTYTKKGIVNSNQTQTFSTDESIARVVVVRQDDQFPVKVSVAAEWDQSSQHFSVTEQDEKSANNAWTFYQTFSSQPYNPVSLQFNQLVEDNAGTPSTLNDKTASFFAQNGYQGVDYAIFTSVAYWVQNQLFAFPGTYYCYEPAASTEGFILPSQLTGVIDISNGQATYTPEGGTPINLEYYNSQLTSTGASPKHGIYLTSLVRNLVWENKDETDITWAFVGNNQGQQMIAQNYKDPSLPWYAIAYDMVYGAYFSVQIYMAVNAAADLLKAAGKGAEWVADNVSKLADNARQWLNKTGDSAGPDSALGDDADPVNIDIDTDTDIDIDVDIDVDIDIDVDVDVDIDVDVDVDFGVVVDVDVDVDIDIDIDIDEQTDVDIDVDVDIDIDTTVDVQPGGVSGLLNKVGNWIMTKAFPTLIEGAAISVAFQTVDKVLMAWKQQDAKDMDNLQPRQTTGLGVLINYMFNTKVSVAERWQTFADYISESKPDTTTIEMNIATIVGTGNKTADDALNNWRWSSSDEQSAVKAMQACASDADAFIKLGQYQYSGKDLPLKVASGVAMKYLKAK